MSSHCGAVNCHNNASRCPNLSFFTFPRKVERCKVWISNVRRADLAEKGCEYASKNVRLCAKHFEDQYFMNADSRNKLTWNAVPTIFEIRNPPKLTPVSKKNRGLRPLAGTTEQDKGGCGKGSLSAADQRRKDRMEAHLKKQVAIKRRKEKKEEDDDEQESSEEETKTVSDRKKAAAAKRVRRQKPATLEVCVDNLTSASNAHSGGAHRLELCSSLAEGGLTPTVGMMATVKKRVPGMPVFALIRPRGGDFLYTKDEVETMSLDIRALAKAGADGFVFGCLDPQGNVDERSCRKLLESCSGLPATFHRAFDMARDARRSMSKICELGFARVLTSGQEESAMKGKELIRDLVDTFGNRISIMIGGGVSSNNVEDLVTSTGAREVHASARKSVDPSGMVFRNERCFMGSNSREYDLMVTAEEEVGRIVECLKGM